jgi:hypothetical protein
MLADFHIGKLDVAKTLLGDIIGLIETVRVPLAAVEGWQLATS